MYIATIEVSKASIAKAWKAILVFFGFKPKPEGSYGLSFDDDVRLDVIPERPEIGVGKFCQLVKEPRYYEVLEIDNDRREILIREICTDNEYVLPTGLFNAVFEEAPMPPECMFPS